MGKVLDAFSVMVHAVVAAIAAFLAVVGFQASNFLADFAVWKSAVVAIVAGAIFAIWEIIKTAVKKTEEVEV